MRLALLAALLLAACGSRQTATGTPVSNATGTTPAAPTEPGADSSQSASASATPVSAAVVQPPADTPLCRRFREVVAAAGDQFSLLAGADAAPLPGATACSVAGGDGPGQTTVTTYTCEYEAAVDRAILAPKRDALEEQLRECGSARALENTRVRIARAGDQAVLVINVHDTVTW